MARRADVKFHDYKADEKDRVVKMSEPITRVLSEEDGWLFVYAPGSEAKVSKADMVLVKDALAYYTEYLRDHAQNAWAWSQRGITRRLHGKFDLAIKDFSEAIKLEPTASHYNNRGSTWSAKLDYDNAIRDYDEAIRIDPNFASAYNNRAIAWWSKNEFVKAFRDFDEAIRHDAKDVCALTNRGFALYLKKDYDKAIRDFDDAIQIDSKYAFAFGNKASALAKLKKYDEAVQSFETAIRSNTVGWLYRDYALFLATCPAAKHRDGKKAIELANKGIELAGDDGNGWEYQAALAAAFAEAGDFEQAVAKQQKSLEDNSLATEDRAKMEKRLKIYRLKVPYRDED